jgi:hypothetical protein
MGNTRIDIQTAIDAHFFKPLPPLSFSETIANPRPGPSLRFLQIRANAPTSGHCRSETSRPDPVLPG